MTFNDDARAGSNRVSRRGRNGAIAGGGGIIALLAVFLIGQFTGIDLTPLLGGAGGSEQGTEVENCDTGAQANADDACRLQFTAESIDAYWVRTAPNFGFQYTEPAVVIFTGSTSTACGTA